MRIFANANYPFLSWRRKSALLSFSLLAIALVAIVFNVATTGSWLRYGVDFSGGTVVHVDFADVVPVDQVRAVNPSWEISSIGQAEESEFLIRVPSFQSELDTGQGSGVEGALTAEFGEDGFQIVQTDAVGPRVGAELQQRALLAILISFVLTLVYLAFRFEWRFGVAAIIATANDILLTLGFLALLRMEVSVATVAAFLTIVGYSLNDTIVVFDRIRENLAKKTRGTSFETIIDRSINETLPRTVLTSVTTLSTLVALYLFGAAVIRDFSLVLILGVVIGTFSSIFVASPALYLIERKWPRAASKATRGSGSSGRRQTARA